MIARSRKGLPPRLSWAIHRDLAQLLSRWDDYVKKLGRDAFSLVLVLEGIRLHARDVDTFVYRDLEDALSISPATLRRWLRTLRNSGLVTMEAVPGSNRTAANFHIHLQASTNRRRTNPLSGERTRSTGRRRAVKTSYRPDRPR